MKIVSSLINRIRTWRKTPRDRDVVAQASCPHQSSPTSFTLVFRGVELQIQESKGCPLCAEKYFRRVTTTCGTCKGPIFPGDPVGRAFGFTFHRFTHLTRGCCLSGVSFCGRWGEGRLVTLHELEPEKYPEGTSSLLEYVVKHPGEIHVTNIE